MLRKKVSIFFSLAFVLFISVSKVSFAKAKVSGGKKKTARKMLVDSKKENTATKVVNKTEKKTLVEDIITEEMIPVSLAHLIDLALKRNNSLRASYLNVDMAESDVKIQKSSLYPTLSANGSYNMSEDFTNDRHTNTTNASLNARYTVFAFGKTTDKVKEVQYRLNSIKYQNNKDVQDLIYTVSNLYYKMLLLMSQKSALVEVEKTSAKTLEVVSLKFKLGIVVLNDKLKARTANDGDKLNLLKIDNQINALKSEINNVLNLEVNYDLYIKEPDDFTIRKSTKSFDELLDIALNNRSELKAKMEEKKMYQKQLDYVGKEFLPSIDASGRVGKQNVKSKNAGVNSNSNDNYGEVGLSVSIPIFSGFDTTNQVKKINSAIKQQDVEIANLKNVISKEVLDAYNNLMTCEESYFIVERMLESSKESTKLALGMYKNGKTTITDLMSANANLKNVRHQYLDSKYSCITAKLELLRKIGKVDIENINNIMEF